MAKARFRPCDCRLKGRALNRALTVRKQSLTKRTPRTGAVVSPDIRRSIRICGRSYLGFVFTPEPPLLEWLNQLDAWLARSPGFFSGKLVVLDLSAVVLSRQAITHLLDSLQERDIRIAGLEGVEPTLAGAGLPPLLQNGRSSSGAGEFDRRPAPKPQSGFGEPPKSKTSLLVDQPVRSGQSIVFGEGDITVLGSVGSGAEVVAGGSIHIYGTLRGRALAGASGNPQARIFCHRIEAELLAIDGYYMTADEVDSALRNRPAQAWLDGRNLMVTAIN
jgi:septum site-determining protein MinC